MADTQTQQREDTRNEKRDGRDSGKGRGPLWVALGLLPLLGLGVVLALIAVNGTGVQRELPPFEELTINRISMPTESEFVVDVTNSGADPVTISQVAVNESVWDFDSDPQGPIPPRGSAEITIPYTWVEAEAYGIDLMTNTGITFSGEVPLATVTPGFTAGTFASYALIGFYVGVVPVSLGLLWYRS